MFTEGTAKRATIVSLRLTDAEAEALQAEAARRGISVSDVIRERVFVRLRPISPPEKIEPLTLAPA